MKKFLLIVLMVLVCGVAKAQDVTAFVDMIPSLKQGVAYSINDSKVNYIATFDIIKAKGFNLEAGYAGVAKNTGDKLVAVVSYDLFDAKKVGVTLPILDLIKFRPGIYAGLGRIEKTGTSEFDFGVSASVIDIKF